LDNYKMLGRGFSDGVAGAAALKKPKGAVNAPVH